VLKISKPFRLYFVSICPYPFQAGFSFELAATRVENPSPFSGLVLILITDFASALYFAPGAVITSTLLMSVDLSWVSSLLSLTRYMKN